MSVYQISSGYPHRPRPHSTQHRPLCTAQEAQVEDGPPDLVLRNRHDCGGRGDGADVASWLLRLSRFGVGDRCAPRSVWDTTSSGPEAVGVVVPALVGMGRSIFVFRPPIRWPELGSTEACGSTCWLNFPGDKV